MKRLLTSPISPALYAALAAAGDEIRMYRPMFGTPRESSPTASTSPPTRQVKRAEARRAAKLARRKAGGQ